ncbi:hypothetical protein BaRGS_00000118 [Batillaria attramentaria]|uniref:Uncharacterized protein n=1 Tax=Batillaria attramentaria TaxID=370345 RepID=A0ABD0MAG0_9CAEN
MSEVLSVVKRALQHALQTTRDLSARAPGTVTVQVLCIGATVCLVGRYLLKKRYRLPPGPSALPLIGNLPTIAYGKDPLYITLSRLTEKYGPAITVYFGPVPCVMLNRADVVTEALVQRGGDFSGRPFLYSLGIMSNGFRNILFSSDSRAWKIHRKIAVQALRHYMSGPRMEEVLHNVVSKAIDKMAAERGPLDPHSLTMILMFVMIDMFCFAGNKELDDPKLEQLRDMFEKLTTEAGNGFLEDIIPPLRYFPTKKFRKFVDRLNQFSAYIYEQIDQHRRTFSRDNMRDITDSILLAQMEAEQEEESDDIQFFTNIHVGQTVADLFGGGVDTSRMTLDWGLYYLASFPEVQKRMQAELDAVTGSRLPGCADRTKLPYTEATLYEILRLGSVTPLSVPHRTLSDTSVGGYEVPKDTMVMINLWALSRDPKHWDQPDAFRPERFLDSEGKLIPRPESFMPFSVGRRSCLGEIVAKPELLLIFACIVKRLTLSLAPGFVFDSKPLNTSMIMHLPQPYKMVVSERSPGERV